MHRFSTPQYRAPEMCDVRRGEPVGPRPAQQSQQHGLRLIAEVMCGHDEPSPLLFRNRFERRPAEPPRGLFEARDVAGCSLGVALCSLSPLFFSVF